MPGNVLHGGHKKGPHPSRAKRIFLVVFGCLQNILAGGIIYGWAGISGSILTTSHEQGGAGLSPALTIHIFSLSTSIGCFSQVPLGLINDKCGPRFCSILSNLLVGLGCFIFVFSQTWKEITNSAEESTTFYTAGAILMAFGQPGVQVPLVHLGNLFPGQENSVISLITSTLSISFVVFPMFSSIWSHYHIDFRLLFRLLGWTIWALALISFYLWPDSPYEKQTLAVTWPVDTHNNQDSNKREEESCRCVDDSNTLDLHATNYKSILDHEPGVTTAKRQRTDSSSRSQERSSDRSLRDQLLSTQMARLTIYFVIAWFWGDMYVATLPVELKDQQYFDADTNNHLVQSFSYMSSLGMFVSPVVGYSIDKFGSLSTCAATFGLGIVQTFLLLSVPLVVTHNKNIPLAKSLLVTNFIMSNLFRTFLYPCFYSSLAELFGMRYIGILSGTVVFIFGIAFLFLVPLGEFALGTCHYLYSSDHHEIVAPDGSTLHTTSTCSHGRWSMLHFIQMTSLTILVFDIWMQEKNKENVSLLDGEKTTFQNTESDTVSDCSSLL
jgi:MFS family permease